jgi:AraC family transcriptional regulator
MSDSSPSVPRRAGADLPSGRYFGAVRHRESYRGFALTELRHERGARLPRHTHAQAYFSLLREGGYTEWLGRDEFEYTPRTVHFHPPGVTHRDAIAAGGASFLIVEIGDALFRRALDLGPIAASRQDLRGGELSQLARRLERERRDPARRSPLVIEGLVLEMLGLVAGTRHADAGRPAWLAAVIERLHDEYAVRLTLEDLARDAGVHPQRLSRTFHRHARMSVGEYVQQLRVRAAESRLGDPERTLAEIALETGFADQSHLTRVFRRVTGRTPGAVRDALTHRRG